MKKHVLAMPMPAQGHINPMLQFSKRLVSQGLQVTILTFSATQSMPIPVGPVKVESVAVGLEAHDELNNFDAYMERLKAVLTQRLPQMIEKLGINCLVYDSHVPWALDIARQQGIPGALFFTQSCAVNTIYCNVHDGLLKLPLAQSSLSIDGLPLLEARDLPSFVCDPGSYPVFLRLLVNQFSNFKEADWVLVNSFSSLEEEVLSWMMSQRPVKTIGPTIPLHYLNEEVEDDKDYGMHFFKPEMDICINWLNSKDIGSVVYVSFGSLAALGEEQMQELASGLKSSNSYFLWVVRESEQEKLPAGFIDETSEKGLVVSWSPQLQVLAHKAAGCFMTHCGWNSTLEALSLGVPMIAVPQWTDQTTNAKFVADVWQVGVRARKDDKGTITKEEIQRCIKEIMEGDKSKLIKRNADKWKKLAREAVNVGGSSDTNIREFVAKLTCN